MSLFVTGTDGGVGKTVVAALVLARYARELPLAYWQPVATGATDGRDRRTIEALVPGAVTAAEAYLFADSVSPHLAARREGLPIEPARVAARLAELDAVLPGRGWIVEGAGGVLVPLDEAGTTLADLAALLRLPALLVARSSPGTVNHTLLSLEALARREVAVAGVVLCGAPAPEERDAIERYGAVEVLAEVPRLPAVDAAIVAAAAAELDPAGALRPWLQPAS